MNKAVSIVFDVTFAPSQDPYLPPASFPPPSFFTTLFPSSWAHLHSTSSHRHTPNPTFPLFPTAHLSACGKQYLLVTLRYRLILSRFTTYVTILILTEMAVHASLLKAGLLLISLCSQCPRCFLTIPLNFRLLSWR